MSPAVEEVQAATDARWRLHVAEDREASHQVRCRSGCKPGASACDTGRALTAVVEADYDACHTCADRGTVQGRPCIDCTTDALTSKGRAFSSLRDAYGIGWRL